MGPGSREVAPSRQPPDLDPAEWLAAHGAPTPAASVGPDAHGCEEVSVGKPPEAGILCSEIEHVTRGQGVDGLYRVLERRKVKVVRSKRSVVVLDAIETVTQLDKEDSDQVDILNLEVTLAADGLSVTVQDRGADLDLSNGNRRHRVTCDEARARGFSQNDDPVGRRWDRFDQELISRACSARGRWVWTAGRFVRKRGP